MATDKRFEQADSLIKDQILNQIPSPVMAFDKNMRIIYVNRQAAALAGRTKEEILGEYCYNIYHTTVCQTDDCGIRHVLKTGKIAARIMAISDVYDALISQRVYKRAYSHEEAVKIIAVKKAAGILTRSLWRRFYPSATSSTGSRRCFPTRTSPRRPIDPPAHVRNRAAGEATYWKFLHE